jgi:hypothetical protein
MGYATRRIRRGVTRGAFGCLGCPLLVAFWTATVIGFGWWLLSLHP